MLHIEAASLMSTSTIGRRLVMGMVLGMLMMGGHVLEGSASTRLQSTATDNPDELYRNRENLESAKRAADLWEPLATANFEAAWKLSRICYWIGTHGPKAERRAALDRGVKAGETAVRLAPGHPDGHFWLAANMSALAESFGLVQGLKYRGRIRDELERVIAIDQAWGEGSAESALGEWYAAVPGIFGGSKKTAEEHQRRALAVNPESRNALLNLAELLIDQGRNDEARTLLQRAIDAPNDPERAPEDRERAGQAAARLKKL